eukprot:scaffold2094_cov239-Pinguiococcus_pyrenoidosus.AAC.3
MPSDGNNLLPIAFVSRSLSQAESRYHGIFLNHAQGGSSLLTEALAVLYVVEDNASLVESFPVVYLNTDHRNLVLGSHSKLVARRVK